MARLWRLLREFPVTAACLVVCIGLFLGSTRPDQTPSKHHEQLHRLGAVVDLPYAWHDGTLLFRAPLALWRGQVWRIAACAFHHVDFWHLFMNSLSAVYLGRLLERRWGSGRTLLMLPAAAFLPMIPEFLTGNYVLGFSGVIAAMFGVLCVLRYQDEELQEELPDEAVYLGGAMLGLGVVFSLLDLVPVANLAHMTGFFWGVSAGCVTTGLPWGRGAAQMIRAAAIVLFAGLLWFVVHPTWDGRYHWYLAMETKDADRRSAELQRAVELHPQETGAWWMLASDALRAGRMIPGWKTILQGLSHNPTDERLMKLARTVWRVVVLDPGRNAARETIAEVFGEQAESWEAQFREGREFLPSPETVVSEIDPVLAYPLNRPLDLRLPELPKQLEEQLIPRRLPPEGDAAEGRRM